MRIIAFSGKSGVGKSTIAKYMQEEFHARKHTYAEVLREEAMAAGFSRDILWHKPTNPAVRRLLIGWGETRRMEYEDYLADILWAKLEKSLRLQDKIVVIDDLRYPNEVAQLRAFETVFGVRVTLVRVECDFNPAIVLHESESALDGYKDWDARFLNENDGWDKLHEFAITLVGEEELDGPDGTDYTAVADGEGRVQRDQEYAYARAMANLPSTNSVFAGSSDSSGDPDRCNGIGTCRCPCLAVHGNSG
jgi:hypothetical protein